MTIIAEMYNQDPDHDIFKMFSSNAMGGVKKLAKAIQKIKKEGKIK